MACAPCGLRDLGHRGPAGAEPAIRRTGAGARGRAAGGLPFPSLPVDVAPAAAWSTAAGATELSRSPPGLWLAGNVPRLASYGTAGKAFCTSIWNSAGLLRRTLATGRRAVQTPVTGTPVTGVNAEASYES